MMDELIAFLRARYEEREQLAVDHLCVYCRRPVIPLRSSLGETGYTHDEGWQGKRCPGSTTGAEPLQSADTVLRDIAGKRKIVDTAEQQPGWEPAAGRDDTARHWDEAAKSMLFEVLHHLAEEFADHPDYDARAWGPLGSGNPVPE